MNDWQRFFDYYANKYDAEVFTQNTHAEIPFIVEHLNLPPAGHLLDLGCGTGRHAVPLAKLGYHVTGVDLSPGMLAEAQRRAQTADVNPEWIQHDATTFVRPDAFDGVICLCEGAFGLLAANDDALDHDQRILENVFRSLRPGGRFLLTMLNACRHIRAYQDTDVDAGRYNVIDLTEPSEVSNLLPADQQLNNLRERGYTPPEIRRMLQWAGFHIHGVYGGTAGDWGLRPLKLDEYELMTLAQKPQ